MHMTTSMLLKNRGHNFLLLIFLILSMQTQVRATTIDYLATSSRSVSGTALGKGNAYRIDETASLIEFEVYLNFSDTQTLSFYVFENDSEFGTYSLVDSKSSEVDGNGRGFYSSGILNNNLISGNWYILAVSWTGIMDYFFGIDDMEEVSFGAHVHGYATGSDPLGETINSNVNDLAVYRQRVTTGPITSVNEAPTIYLLLFTVICLRFFCKSNRPNFIP